MNNGFYLFNLCYARTFYFPFHWNCDVDKILTKFLLCKGTRLILVILIIFQQAFYQVKLHPLTNTNTKGPLMAFSLDVALEGEGGGGFFGKTEDFKITPLIA